MIVTINKPYLRSLNDLIEYLLSKDNYVSTYPDDLYKSADDYGKVFLYLNQYAYSTQAEIIESLSKIIDFDECDEGVLDAYGEMNNIPLPNFPTTSNVRTHVINDVNVEGEVYYEHKLCTLDYIVQVQWKNETNDWTVCLKESTYILGAHFISLDFDDASQTLDPKDIKILFMYKEDYTLGKRLICKNIKTLRSLRGTFEGIRSYIYFLCNNCVNYDVDYYTRKYPFLQCYSDTIQRFESYWLSPRVKSGAGFTRPPSTNNGYSQIYTLLYGSDYDVTPRLIDLSGGLNTIISTGITFNIMTDLTPRLEEFIKDAILNYFIPFPEIYKQYVKFNFTNNMLRW